MSREHQLLRYPYNRGLPDHKLLWCRPHTTSQLQAVGETQRKPTDTQRKPNEPLKGEVCQAVTVIASRVL